MSILLEVNNLSVRINNAFHSISILKNLSFTINTGDVLAVSGPSGSGKTITALSLMGLLPAQAEIYSGEMCFNGDVIKMTCEESLGKMRGKNISMIFQEPHAALNPVRNIGNQLNDIIKRHYRNLQKKEIAAKSIEILTDVGFQNPEIIYKSYPHQLSGGMAQRVIIACALSCRPSLLIADEPTTALDATTQILILKLLRDLQEKMHFSMLLISHDINVLLTLAKRIIRMHEGQIIEEIELNA